jgi:hypothetical protein
VPRWYVGATLDIAVSVAISTNPPSSRPWLRRRWLSLIAVALALIALGVVFGPIGAAGAQRLLIWAMTDSDGGDVSIEPGDRYAEVRFGVPFSSPPAVTLVPGIVLGTTSFAVPRVEGNGFRVELSEPAASTTWFSWAAVWNVAARLDYDQERGLPARLPATVDARAFEVRLESYRDDRPTAMLVPATTLAELAADDETVAAAAITAAQRWYNDSFTCSWLDKLRFRLNARVLPCPALGPGRSRPAWRSDASDGWTAKRSVRGLEIAAAGIASPDPQVERDTKQAWADLLRGATAVDLIRHNNQVLDFVDALTVDGKLGASARLTVIHFDTHSDMHVYPDPTVNTDREDISDFINRLLTDGRVAEVYWVLPDWTEGPAYRDTFWQAPLPAKADSYAEGPRDLEVFVDRANRLLYFGTRPGDAAELERVVVHKVLLRDLPDFRTRRDVYLEIDGDYFSNTGFDTPRRGRVNPTRAELFGNFSSVAKTLAARGVRPLIASWCLSPNYTAPEDEIDEERFFLGVLDAMPADDYLLGYRHLEESGLSARAGTRRRDTPLGKYLLALAAADLARPDGDRRIELTGDELDGALRLAAERLGLDAARGRVLLRRLDRFDGRLDGVIDLADAEYYSAIDDPERLIRDLAPRPSG